MRVGIIGSLEDEIMLFIDEVSNKKLEYHAMLKFYIGKYENIDIVSLYCGGCKVNAAIAAQIV